MAMAAELPETEIALILSSADSLWELLAAGRTCKAWLAAARSTPELRANLQRYARRLCLPPPLERLLHLGLQRRKTTSSGVDWFRFCGWQLGAQRALSGRYAGTVTPENRPATRPEGFYDWSKELEVLAEFHPAALDKDRRAWVSRQTLSDGQALEADSGIYDWLVLDPHRKDGALLCDLFELTRDKAEGPEERWEDGDLHCGVRGSFDFRPAVDPEFLDISGLLVLLCRQAGSQLLVWQPRLFAPCAWMLPKQPKKLHQLDFGAEFKNSCTVVALTLGTQLERPGDFGLVERLLQLVRREVPAEAASGPKSQSASRKGAKKSHRGEPRNRCSGRNPRGLNLFVPRRKASEVCQKEVAKRDSLLACATDVAGFLDFLATYRPTRRDAEQLLIRSPEPVTLEDGPAFDAEGLLADVARFERTGPLNQALVLELAKKWHCLSGKWLLFVPEWCIDQLWDTAAMRLASGRLTGCTQLIVSPPGAYRTDADRYMLSAHCADFTNVKEVMGVGKSLRASAREGLRGPAGDWGELHDDPFSEPKKRPVLVFKPDVFTKLSLHRNNRFGMKISLYSLDL